GPVRGVPRARHERGGGGSAGGAGAGGVCRGVGGAEPDPRAAAPPARGTLRRARPASRGEVAARVAGERHGGVGGGDGGDAGAGRSRTPAPRHGRLAEHYAEPGRHGAERWLLVLLASGTVAWVAVTQVTRAPGGASIFFWAVLAVATAVCALVPLAAFLGVSVRVEARGIARWIRSAILALGLLAVLLAALGAALAVY